MYSNTTINNHFFPGTAHTPFDPTQQFMWGFKGPSESVEEIVESDRLLLKKLGITYEQAASVIDTIFATKEDEFSGHKIVRWDYIHSPVCPWGDFCTKSCFDLVLTVTEIWLVDPRYSKEVKKFIKKAPNRNHLIGNLKELVDKEWVMVFSDLHPHLIREHHFFEGFETPYRVDPNKILKLI